MNHTEQPVPLACQLNAMTPAQRARHTELVTKLRDDLTEMKAVPGGYAFRYSTTPELSMAAAEFISLESLCCPFFNFSLEKDAEEEVWLRITGPEDTGEIIKRALGGALTD